MSIFGFGKKKKDAATDLPAAEMPEQPTFKQDLSEKAQYSGIYHIMLLFREQVVMPSQEAILEKLQAHFGDIDTVSNADGLMSFAIHKYPVTYQDATVPAQLLLTGCNPAEPAKIADDIARTQFWDCPNGNDLLNSCKWSVMASDFMAGGLPAIKRAELISDWLDIVLSLFPTCDAVFYTPSGKLLAADDARDNPYQGVLRFVHGGINARLFNIEGTDSHVIDTLGLYKLGLPDMQYHFHGCDSNEVVRHAYNTAIYQFLNNAPIESGHTIEGIEPGDKWRCNYESSLIQPVRDVLDIEMGMYASGNRN